MEGDNSDTAEKKDSAGLTLARMSARKVRAERAVARAEGLRKAVGTPPSQDGEKVEEEEQEQEDGKQDTAEDSLEGMSRQALQRLAKKHGVRANQKSVVLRRELQKILSATAAPIEEEDETY